MQLRAWFNEMTYKYSWLRIKFEFSKVRGLFMVSFSPISQIELSDEFNIEAMQFADKMNATYGNEAPLFTDEEELFRLSPKAEEVSAGTFVSSGNPTITAVSFQPHREYETWVAACTTTAPVDNKFRSTSSAAYAEAA